MQHRISHTTPATWPSIKSGRFAASIHGDSPRDCALALLGLPDDTGVKFNGGRPGAAVGPGAFRAALASYGTAWDAVHCRVLDVPIFDAGDIEPASGESESALAETHARAEQVAGELHALGLLPICIGGGHDLSLPTITALAKHAGGPVGGINVDAHLDARQAAGSGMAFRRLIEQGYLDPQRFMEVGLGQFASDPGDFQWLAEQGVQMVGDGEILDRLKSAEAKSLFEGWFDLATSGGKRPAFCSLDLDVIGSAEAPGVSALNPLGLAVRDAAALASAAGENRNIRHFDIMELCPPHDQDGRTARVAALLFLSFLSGWMTRPA